MKFAHIVLALPLLSPVAWGQSEDQLKREEAVIVTAPGIEKLAGELISKVDALDRDDLIADLQGTLGDTLARRPGVSTTFFGAGASRPVLRGLGSERVLVLTNGMGVIDVSAASPDHQTGTDGIDAERVEILRGPAALAYGGQAIGGVVNVIDGLVVSQKPDDAFYGQGYAAYNGVNEGQELAGRAGFVVGDLVFNFSASKRDFDDYEIPGYAESARLRASEEEEHDHEDHDHEDEEDHDEHEEEARDLLENSFLESETLAAGVSWVGDNAYLGLAVRRQTATYGLPGHDHEHGEEEHDDHEDEDHEDEHGEESPFIDLEQVRVDFQGGYRFDHDILDELTFKLTSGDYEHAEFEGPGEIGTQYFTDGLEGRVELDHSFGDSNGTIGLQFVDKSFNAVGDEAFITPTDTKSLGLFVYEAREWSNGFGIEGGGRIESVELDNVNAGSRDFDLLSASFGAHQHYTNGWFIGAQVALTERAPNESELFADGAHLATDQYEVGNPDMDVERGLNLEGTVRWTNDQIEIGANLFHTDFSDFIYLTPGMTEEGGVLVDEVDGTPVYLFAQEDAQFQGGELYLRYHVSDGPLGAHWDLSTSLDFVHAELDSGANVPYLPPVKFVADLTADWGLFDAGVGVVMAADQDDVSEGVLPTDGYAVIDLDAGLNLDQWLTALHGTRLFVQARNVTDEEVRYATAVLKGSVPAPGRNIRFGVSAKF